MWIYRGEELSTIPKGYVGFVYTITNIQTNKKYIGRKLFNFTKTKTVKGKKIKVLSDSLWLSYTGSNTLLNEEIKISGRDNYSFEVIYLCHTKSEMNYLESKEIFLKDALLRDDYFNQWISCKITRMHLQKYSKKLSDEHLQNVKTDTINN